MGYQNPCEGCGQVHCHSKACARWRVRYLYRQAQINAYAKHHGIVPDSPDYVRGQDPCIGCAREEVCTSFCRAKADYWDYFRTEILRKWG